MERAHSPGVKEGARSHALLTSHQRLGSWRKQFRIQQFPCFKCLSGSMKKLCAIPNATNQVQKMENSTQAWQRHPPPRRRNRPVNDPLAYARARYRVNLFGREPTKG